VNVTVPPGDDPPVNAADTSDAATGVPARPDAGAVSDSDVETAGTIISGIEAPHGVDDGVLRSSGGA
jgi:hypothetical protein